MPSIKKPSPGEDAPPVAPVRHSLRRDPSGGHTSGTNPADDTYRKHSLKKNPSGDSFQVQHTGSLKKHPSVDSSHHPGSLKKHPSVDSSHHGSSIKKHHEQAEDKAAIARLDRIKKMAEERYQFEQRVLTLCTGMLVVIAVIWTVALSTDHWYTLDPPPGGVFLRDSRTVLRSGHTGLWRICSEQFHPSNISDYESITTTVAPVSTTKRPRAQPCKWMGLRGRKRKRCRQFITNRFRFGLAARRKSSLRLDVSQRPGGAEAAGGAATAVTPVTTPTTPLDYDDPSLNLTDWLKADFDEQVSHAGDSDMDNASPVDEDVLLGPVDPEREKYLAMVEEEILERIRDGVEDDNTVNETLADALEEAIEEITSVVFRECRVRELSENGLEQSTVEWQMLSYMRTLVTFSVVSIFLLVLGFLSALYTFKEPRYTFKRLSAGIQFIAFCGLLVVIQVFRNAALYEQWALLGGVPLTIGYSQALAWTALSAQLLSSFFFLLYSRKKKRQKAPNEELAMADEPTIIGR